MVTRLLNVGFAVRDVGETLDALETLLGLPGEHLGADPFSGADNSGRMPFPNGCWLHVMESDEPGSPISKYIEDRGPGLERIVLLVDDGEAALRRVQDAGVDLPDDALVDTPTGRRFVVPPEHVTGIRVELLERAPDRWVHEVPSNISGVLGLQHIGVATRDLKETCKAFSELFGLDAENLRTDQHGGDQKDAMIKPGNDRLWLHVTESWGPTARVKRFLDQKGEGVEHLSIEVDDIRKAVIRVTNAGVPIHDHKIFTNRPDGFEAFIYPEYTTGVTVELIEPYPTSRGCRPGG